MGIQGLLQFIKEASEPIHVRKYKGQVVAVDTYCWLHKGAIPCAEKLAKGEPTDKYVGFCMKFVTMLLSHGIKPILVFDGCTLPSKKEVEKSRKERRQANLLKGKQLLREGKISEARDCFTRSVNITHAMAHRVIKAARSLRVDCLVAPYEADAQLAYLNKAGIVQAIITEDSDLLAFGCKKVILKMDHLGNGLEIDQCRFGMCRQLGDVFTEEKFRYMCILSGCDYLSSLRGIGLAKACKLLRLANNPDIIKVIKKIGHYLKMNITVPEDYIKGFIRANNTFLYQLVFDPIKRKLIPLNAYEDGIDPKTLSYAGCYIDDSVALQIALGNKDINTFEQIDDYNPDTATPAQPRSHSWNDNTCQKSNMNSIWHRNYSPGFEADTDPKATPVKERTSTLGVERVISIKRLNLPRKSTTVKRPRSEELSEDDLLRQYDLSCVKKTRKEDCDSSKSLSSPGMCLTDLVDGTASKGSFSTPPRTRNKFATFLQRRNEESGAIVVPGTRSRFFCSSLDSVDCDSKKESSQPFEGSATSNKENDLIESDCSHGEKLDEEAAQNSSDQIADDVTVFAAETPPPAFKTSRFTRTISPPTLGKLRSCFSWSGSLGHFSRTPSPSPSTALQQFHEERNSPSLPPEKEETTGASPSRSDDVRCDSQPLPEAGCLSQPHLELSPHSPSAPEPSPPSSKESDSEESDSNSKSPDNQGCQNSKLNSSHFFKKDKLLKNKVPGLYKSNSVDSLSTTKIKPLVPAKVSGLSRKSAGIQRRKHHNAENKPGLQIKISELWKNFGYKKDSEKLASCKKPDPLSPVKDNIQLTPEADDDIFNKSECARVQRAIFQ
ncbi:PREDICTED: exonuclease 1-like [Elephantulus edwardii]|uniref:exonuclease 1-like n=1 Tax=Elephantulus edwardii TaxID=28737 RepID=UPI0003F0C183|nr:PREDICTED: exonuclease 1-like [Elephantulus edwardii]